MSERDQAQRTSLEFVSSLLVSDARAQSPRDHELEAKLLQLKRANEALQQPSRSKHLRDRDRRRASAGIEPGSADPRIVLG